MRWILSLLCLDFVVAASGNLPDKPPCAETVQNRVRKTALLGWWDIHEAPFSLDMGTGEGHSWNFVGGDEGLYAHLYWENGQVERVCTCTVHVNDRFSPPRMDVEYSIQGQSEKRVVHPGSSKSPTTA
jgi:hypothetical protein